MSEKTDEKQESKGKICTGDCLECNMQQRIYCSAQVGRNSLVLLESLSQDVTDLRSLVKDLTQEVSELKKGSDLIPVSSGK